jgi:hypothetical protein
MAKLWYFWRQKFHDIQRSAGDGNRVAFVYLVTPRLPKRAYCHNEIGRSLSTYCNSQTNQYFDGAMDLDLNVAYPKTLGNLQRAFAGMR